MVARTLSEICDGVGAGRGEDRHRDRGLVVEQRAQRVLGSAQLDARHVAKPRDGAVRLRLHDDVAELLFALQAPLRVDRELQVHMPRSWAKRRRRRPRPARSARGSQRTTSLGGKPALGHLARIEPHAHGVVARAEELHLAHAVDAREAVLDVEQRVVAQVRHVVALVGRHEVHDHREVGRALGGRDAEAAHFLGQARLGLRDAVLHELLRLVGIGAELEGDGQRHACRRWSPGCPCRACSRRR